MNHPSQDFEMNEAWILSDAGVPRNEAAPNGAARSTKETKQARWSGVTDTNGRYLLDGPETWSYANGAKQYEVTWRAGAKTGVETYWSPDGKKEWEWDRRADGVSVWTQYWPNGKKKHESSWRDGKCVGHATAWAPSGEVAGTYEFVDGDLKR
jgi:antitoxin component YwqK of YwqJK toxin-antitoxin module